MTILPHALMGGLVGGLFPRNRFWAFLGGIFSHLFLDLVPHWDYRTAWAGAASTILSFAALVVLSKHWKKATIFWGGLGAMFPDLEVALVFFSVIRPDQMVFPTHTFLPHPQASIFYSAFLQVLFSLVCFFLLWRGWSTLKGKPSSNNA